MKKKILVINPGSTSTKLSLYEDEKRIWEGGGHHPSKELSQFRHVNEQYDYRKNFIIASLLKGGIPLKFDAVIARGGLMRPTPSGVYIVSELMKHDLINAKLKHACNLGGVLADDIGQMSGCHGYIADPEVVDELMPMARYTGLPEIKRLSVFHALNSKAVSRRYAAGTGKKYEELNLIVVHLGGGISISAHHHGKVIDVNNALNGDGPFGPERAGTLPADQFAELCFSGKYTLEEVKKLICGKGGLVALLGTNDIKDIVNKAANGEQPFKEVIDSMLYITSKHVGAMAVTLTGKVDAIIITGGIANNEYSVKQISERVSFLGKIIVMPGEDEMGSLAYNALGALNGTLPLMEYKPE